MDILPFELIKCIFNYLNLKDKIKCRRINKHFLNLIDNYLIDDKNVLLFAETIQSYYQILRFFFTNNYVYDHNLIVELKLNDTFFNHSSLILTNQIKQLVICELSKSILIAILKSFTKIEILYLHNFNDQNTINDNLFIKLDHLKILELGYCKREQFKFYLPSLKKLSIIFPSRAFNLRYKFIYPKSIEYCKFTRYYKMIDKFINLKVLYCYDFVNNFGREIDRIESNFLTNFPKLEQLHLDEIEYFKILKTQQTIYKLDQIKIYLFGLQLNNSNDYKGCTREFDIDKFDLYIKNQSKLAEHRIPFAQHKLNYELIKPIYTKLPRNFFLKLDDTDYLLLYGVIMENEFIDFLKFTSIKFHCLELKICVPFCGEFFFQNLFIHCPYLSKIGFLKDEDNPKEIEIKEDDYNVLYQFSNLVEIEFLNLEITNNFAKNLFKNLNKLRFLYFDFNKQELGLFKDNKNEFELRDYEELTKDKIIFKDLESIDFNMI